VPRLARLYSGINLLLLLLQPGIAVALDNDGKVPVLLYHSWVREGCVAATNNSFGMAEDLDVIHAMGFTVVPLEWITRWAIGERDGSTLPDRVVGLSFDDGFNGDWQDESTDGCEVKSFHTLLQEFRTAHPELPAYSPHGSAFVIGSPVARALIGGAEVTDQWWPMADSSNLMSIYNHSTDHDHHNILGTSGDHKPIIETHPTFVDPVLFPEGVRLVGGGYYDGNWDGMGGLDTAVHPQARFLRIRNLTSARAEILMTGRYIEKKIGRHADIFAYPYGRVTEYLRDTYFPDYFAEHGIYAAYATGSNYVTRSSNRYALGRFTRSPVGDWNDKEGLKKILENALK
jgi:hypothetical protein